MSADQAPVQVAAPPTWRQSAPAVRPPVWIPPGAGVQIGPRFVRGGMLYFGSVPSNHVDTHLDGEVIDPGMPVDWKRPDFAGQSMDYWPAYHSITSQSRAAYLLWLESGRSAPDAYIGYVFLYFYGLERRVLLDGRRDPMVQGELPQITAEVGRLLRIYGDNRSFHGYATEFEQLLQALQAQGNPQVADAPPDPELHDRWHPPFELRAGLGLFAAAGRPVPSEWALAWSKLHPEIYSRTPATRCPAEFGTLFVQRYRERHGEGLVVRPGRQKLALSYHAASAGITDAELVLDVPDVLTAPEATKALTELVDSCTNDLDAYSRLLGRQPDAAGKISALAILPAELLTDDLPALRPVKDLIDRHLPHGTSQSVADMGEVIWLWPARTPGKFAKADAVGVAQLMERFGVGIEPDVRMGGAAQVSGPVVLFRTGDHPPAVASPEYAAATALLHLAAVVSASDDDVSDTERDHLINHLESSLHLTPGERVRLNAHLAWLLAAKVKLTGMKKRLAGLSPRQRAHVGEFAITVAAVDGRVTPSEVKTLRKIYTLLELDPDAVYSQLHGVAAQPLAATEPVTVVPADKAPAGYRIPPPPQQEAELQLDPELIRQRMAESAAVAALLADVFEDAPDVAEAAQENQVSADVTNAVPVGTLDSAHSALVHQLAARPEWTRQEFEDVCESLGLMPEGAMDVINEAAVEIADEPLVDDAGDQLRMNNYALGELLA